MNEQSFLDGNLEEGFVDVTPGHTIKFAYLAIGICLLQVKLLVSTNTHSHTEYSTIFVEMSQGKNFVNIHPNEVSCHTHSKMMIKPHTL